MMMIGALLLAAGVASANPPPPIFAPKSVVLFQGDSITHGGRKGDMNHYLGHGYQAEIAMRYLAYRPEDGLQFANRGISGNTSADLVVRWNCDAVPFAAQENGYERVFGRQGEDGKLTPDYLSILVGINDGSRLTIEDYERNLRFMVTNSLAANPQMKIVLCEPFRLPAEKDSPLTRRQEVVRRLAGEYKLAFVPFQRLFSEELMALKPEAGYWFWDSAHPTYAAHMKMADFWIKCVAEQYSTF